MTLVQLRIFLAVAELGNVAQHGKAVRQVLRHVAHVKVGLEETVRALLHWRLEAAEGVVCGKNLSEKEMWE